MAAWKIVFAGSTGASFAAADDSLLVGQIAVQLRVSISYVSKVLSRRRRTGQTTELPQRRHVPLKLIDLYGAI